MKASLSAWEEWVQSLPRTTDKLDPASVCADPAKCLNSAGKPNKRGADGCNGGLANRWRFGSCDEFGARRSTWTVGEASSPRQSPKQVAVR